MKASFGIALGVSFVHLVLWLFGADEHVSFLSGQPLSSWSTILGPLYVLTYLSFVVIAPISLVAAILAWAVDARRRSAIQS